MNVPYYLADYIIRDSDDLYVAELIGFDSERMALLLNRLDEARTVEIDRDIKAANLQLLVEKVLDYNDLAEAAVGDEAHVDTLEAKRVLHELVDLARSLAQ